MKTLKIRNLIFSLHRYLGLLAGIVIAIVGLTGSLLVFHEELESLLVRQRLGAITPKPEAIEIEQIFTTVQTEATKLGLRIGAIVPPQHVDAPYQARLWDQSDRLTQLFLDPYTGKLMGSIQEQTSILGTALRLHYQLMAGDLGTQVVGVAAFLLLLLSLTGIVLWPGWRKLSVGFKIKWNAHPKRMTFDLHKVAGIIAAVFLAFTAFTGFCWNFYDIAEPAIYAMTFTAKQPEPESTPLSGKSSLNLDKIAAAAEVALPGGKTSWINLPNAPTNPFILYKKFPGTGKFDNAVYLDQFTSAVLRVNKAENLLLGDRILNAFTPLHYGTFGGLTTRILYIFVGFAPTLLLITGFVMWRYRKRNVTKLSEPTESATMAGR